MLLQAGVSISDLCLRAGKAASILGMLRRAVMTSSAYVEAHLGMGGLYPVRP